MEPPVKSIRVLLIRGLLIVFLAANITVVAVVMPQFVPLETERTRSISDLTRVRGEFFANRRVICLVLYETYGASTLVITPEAFNYLGLTKGEVKRFARFNQVKIIPGAQMPEGLTDGRALLHTTDLETPEQKFTFLDLRRGETARYVYATVSDEGVVFIPGER